MTLAVLALAARLAAGWLVAGAPSLDPPAAAYRAEAAVVAHGGWSGTRADLLPGPVYLLAAGDRLGMGEEAQRALAALVGALVVFVAVRLASHLFGLRVAVLGGLLTAFSPYLVILAHSLRPENPLMLCLLAAVYAVYRRQEGGGRRWLVGAGLALGAGFAFYPVMPVAVLVLALWHARRSGVRHRRADAAFLAVVALAAMLPPVYRVFHLGGLPAAAVLAHPGSVDRFPETLLGYGIAIPPGGSHSLTSQLASLPMLVLALGGSVLFLKRWRLLFPLFALPVACTLASLVVSTTASPRFAVEPFLLILAAAAMVRLLGPQALGGRVGNRLASRFIDPSMAQGVAE